MQQSSS